MKMKKIILTALVFALVVASGNLFASDITGKWKTIDDETGETKSIVKITLWNGYAYGDIQKLFRKPNEEQDPKCTECKGANHGKRIVGLQILKDMKQDGDDWVGGTILDPKNGKVYRCKMWVENGKLKVRGYLGPFYRTQTWYRAN